MEKWEPSFDGDLALLAWFLHLGETGDLEKVFSAAAHRLGMFMRQFDAPCELLYTKDEHGWAGCTWTWPLMDGGTFNLWIREDKRHAPSTLKFVREALTRAFERYPVMLVVTRSDAVYRQAQRLGFKLLGEIPYFFDGDSALVGIATPFDFEAATQPEAKDLH